MDNIFPTGINFKRVEMRRIAWKEEREIQLKCMLEMWVLNVRMK